MAAWVAGIALGAAPVSARADDQPPDPADLVHADLVAAEDGVAASKPVLLGLRLRHAPHWHTYWVQPGDAGLPTRLRWKLAPGYAAGPIQWPVPSLLRVGDLANYGYEGEVILPIELRVPAAAKIGTTAHIAAHADWLVCSDMCIPGGADLTLDLPVRAPGALHPSADADALAAARARVPAPLELEEARARLEGTRVQLDFSAPRTVARALVFFPLDGGRIVPAAPQRLSLEGGRVALQLQASTPVAPDFDTLRGVLVADGGPPPSGTGWAAQVAFTIARAAAPVPVTPAPARGASVTATPASGAPAAVEPAAAPLSLMLALVGAFIGGAILNLMPCVFPVLSLKLLGLVQHRDEHPERLRWHGLAYGSGVMLSFLLLAAALLAMRAAGLQLGWGFQLQSPLVVAALIGLFFLIGLNLVGTFEITVGTAVANSRAARALEGEALRGSFGTGVLAAVVASPCTAPFMGAALGFAVTQPAAEACAVFAALGAGMALPYVVLTWAPGLLARLPRPGPWMLRLKQALAFPMFVTCVWLLWVLGQQVDIDGLAWTLLALVCAAFGAWALGIAQQGGRRFGWLAALAALGVVATAVPLSRAGVQPAARATAATAADDWSGWSPAVQAQALARGSPVFVDFTAAWCITCQANKRLVLHDPGVEDAFRRGGVVRLRADWTQPDAAIARELQRFARSGVPMYVLYDRRGVPHLLPEILSTRGVLEALARL